MPPLTFMTQLTINVTINLKQYVNVDRYAKDNQATLVRTAAQKYADYLRERYIVFSSGGGDWPPLEKDTIKRKERRIREGYPGGDPKLILRETDTLLNEIGVRRRGKYTYVGYVRESDHPRGPSVNRLVVIHSDGEGYEPQRDIIVQPSNEVAKEMSEEVKKEYNKVIRRFRKK